MASPDDLRTQNEDIIDGENKFDYLKAKYIFRFPFTWTAIKWGLALGSFFGVHQFIKSRSLSASLQWFVIGNIFTGMPIWGFFMFKYSFYTVSIRKFEIEQSNSMEDVNLSREYMLYKLKCNPQISDKTLIDLYQRKADELRCKYNLLDELVADLKNEDFDLNVDDYTNK